MPWIDRRADDDEIERKFAFNGVQLGNVSNVFVHSFVDSPPDPIADAL